MSETDGGKCSWSLIVPHANLAPLSFSFHNYLFSCARWVSGSGVAAGGLEPPPLKFWPHMGISPNRGNKYWGGLVGTFQRSNYPSIFIARLDLKFTLQAKWNDAPSKRIKVIAIFLLIVPISELRSRIFWVFSLNFVSINVIWVRNLWLIFLNYLQQPKLPKYDIRNFKIKHRCT